jgi:hypothetical protein
MSETRSEASLPSDYMGRCYYKQQEQLIREREQAIIVAAQRDKLLAENTRLKEQNARQCKTITESDIAIENAAVRLRWFQGHVAELQEQARIRSASAAPLRSCFGFEPGKTYQFKPKTITVDANHPSLITLTF